MHSQSIPLTPMPITILSAGAGSGKTYTLTERMFALIEQGMRPCGIIATTFTQKAAAELYERVRSRLIQAGKTEAAHDLGSALIGTVHSIGKRLLERFAFEAGASPIVEVIAEGDHQRLFNESLAEVLDEERIATMNHLADMLGLTKKSPNGTYDWRADIRRITEAARANMFSAEALQRSKQRSVETLLALLPPCSDQSAEVWNQQLANLLAQTIEALENHSADDTKKTREIAEDLRAMQTALAHRGFLYWHEWAKIGKMSVAAKSRDLFEPLRAFAHDHGANPAFRNDIRLYISTAFDIAADAIAEYQRYKRKRGLIDYTDMEAQVAQLLRIPSVRQTLAAEIDLLLVDEFQDTSPIQLDIFLQLSQLARQAIWVGDPKQSIYGFRGADPSLMEAVIEATGGIQPENILRYSWRSRPDLVYFANAIFTQAFRHLPTEQVALEPALSLERYTHPQAPPALIHWHFLSQSEHRRLPAKPWLECHVARQIRALLERQIPVWDKKRTHTRPARPEDIAVLCRTNRDAEVMAQALCDTGLKAAVERSGLLQTTEGHLLTACLKWLLNPADDLSAAEILVLSGAQTIHDIVDYRLARPEEGWDMERFDILRQLHHLRPQVADLSPAETLELLIATLQLQHIAVAWGNPDRRLDNLDRLRAYAAEYESACQRMQTGASLGGFLLWLNELAYHNDDRQGSGESPDTVRVMTYHRSKGLEFPIVVCLQLDAKPKDNIWGVAVESERPTPDLNDILGGRWLRFWVNPYADQEKKTALHDALLQTPHWEQALRQGREEEARLLYVGLTRARDYLILPTGPTGTPWLSRVFFGDDGIPLLDPQNPEIPLQWQGHALMAETAVFIEPAELPKPLPPDPQPLRYFERPPGANAADLPLLWIDAQTEMPPTPTVHWNDLVPFAPPLSFKGEYSPSLERAVQVFFATDAPELAPQQRTQLATDILQNYGVASSISLPSLLQHADAFQCYLWPNGRPQTTAAFPLAGAEGPRRVSLAADLFWQDGHGVAILFFAGFAEEMKKSREQLRAITPKVAWAVRLLAPCYSTPITCWAVFAVEGYMAKASLSSLT